MIYYGTVKSLRRFCRKHSIKLTEQIRCKGGLRCNVIVPLDTPLREGVVLGRGPRTLRINPKDPKTA